MPVVRVEASIPLMLKSEMLRVPVNVVLLSMTAVSCASGKLLLLPVPPDEGAHELEPAQVVLVPTR